MRDLTDRQKRFLEVYLDLFDEIHEMTNLHTIHCRTRTYDLREVRSTVSMVLERGWYRNTGDPLEHTQADTLNDLKEIYTALKSLHIGMI
jgi:hypothetical protein